MIPEYILTEEAQNRIDAWKRNDKDLDLPELEIQSITPNFDSSIITIELRLKKDK